MSELETKILENLKIYFESEDNDDFRACTVVLKALFESEYTKREAELIEMMGSKDVAICHRCHGVYKSEHKECPALKVDNTNIAPDNILTTQTKEKENHE